MLDYSTPRAIKRYPLTRMVIEPQISEGNPLQYIEVGWLSSESTLTITAVQKLNSRGGMTIVGVDIEAAIYVGHNSDLSTLLNALELYAAEPRAHDSGALNHYHVTFTLGGSRGSDKLRNVINSDGERLLQMCNLNAPVAITIVAEANAIIPRTNLKFSTRLKKFSDILWG